MSRTEIKRLQRELGITTVFVTHDQEEAMVLSDRIAIMRGGKLQQIGPPMEVYRRPANQFVAGFIGSPAMNFLDGELARQDGRLRFHTGQRTIDLPDGSVSGDGLSGPARPREAALGIRPTDLLVGAEKELTLEGEVFLVEPIGPVSYVDVDVDGIAVKGVCDPDAAPAVGERVRLGCTTARVHLFDRATGQRI